MTEFIISTDSTCDLPQEYVEKHNLYIEPLYYVIDDVTYGGDNPIEPKKFYDMMRDGAIPKTSASNMDHLTNSFRSILESGRDILHISFSSALSCSHNNAVIVANELREEYPERQILVVDSLSASLGQGLMVHVAVRKREAGETIESIAAWLEENKLHFCHQFTVEDLKYLQRGGRLSRATAIIGTLINVKPVLHVDNEGRLVPLHNVRGRKKSLIALVDNMGAQLEGFDNDCIFISHGDSLEDAQFVGNLVRERYGISEIMYHYVSPTIGAHSGPGTIALFYMGKVR